MGNSELTRLWNLCPDNLEACRGDDRNFLPTIESYLENPKDKSDPSYEWRALRLLARQSPLFFTHLAAPTKIPDYLKKIREKIHETTTKNVKTEQENSKPENDGDLVVEKEDVEDDSDLMRADQLTQDDRNVHKTVTATEEQMKALCVIINDDWKKLADKLGMLCGRGNGDNGQRTDIKMEFFFRFQARRNSTFCRVEANVIRTMWNNAANLAGRRR